MIYVISEKNNWNMLKLSKKIEYGLLAMQYIASNIENNREKVISAKEISSKLNIPFEFLSKTLQKLMKSGLIESQQGNKGGYILAKSPDSTSLAEIIIALDEKAELVECFTTQNDSTCSRTNKCSIRGPIKNIQNKIDRVFKSTTLAELLDNKFINKNTQ
jgi:Rrf2 family protein